MADQYLIDQRTCDAAIVTGVRQSLVSASRTSYSPARISSRVDCRRRSLRHIYVPFGLITNMLGALAW